MIPLRNGWAFEIWPIYSEMVHNALFFDLIAHEIPQAFLLGILNAIEEHESLLIIIAAILLALLRRLHSSKQGETPSKSTDPQERQFAYSTNRQQHGHAEGLRAQKVMAGEAAGEELRVIVLDPMLEDLAREGARRILATALEAEVDACRAELKS